MNYPATQKPIKVTTAPIYPTVEEFQPPQPGRLEINDDLILQGYHLEPEISAAGSEVWVTLYWQALDDITHDYVILLRLLDGEQEVAYWLGRPVRSGYPSTEWRMNQIVQDPWLLIVPTEVTAGIYQLELAVFDAENEAEVARKIIGTLSVK